MNDHLAYVYFVPRNTKVRIDETVLLTEYIWADQDKKGRVLGLEIESPVEIWVNGKKVWPTAITNQK